MRAIVFGGILSALVLSPLAGRAAEPATPDAIAGLIQRLSSSKFQERERADRELRRIGEPALKLLKEAAKAQDNDVYDRAAAAIRAIEQKIENDKLLLAPKLQLKYDKVPLNEAIADLAKKTGLKYQLDPKSIVDPKRQITLDTGDVPYWEAVERFLAIAGLTELAPATPIPDGTQSTIEIQGGPQGRVMRTYRGQRGVQPAVDTAVRLVEAKSPLSCSSNTLIRVKALPKDTAGSAVSKGSNQVTLVLEVTPAPSLVWQGVVNVDIRKVVDDRGTLLAQSHIGSGINLGANNSINGIQIIQQGQAQIIINGNVQVWDNSGYSPNIAAANPRHVPVTLLTKDHGAKSLKELEGVIVAEVLTPPEAIVTLDNLRQAAVKESVSKADYQIAVEERTEQNNAVRLKIRVRMPVRNEFVAFQGRGGRALRLNGGFGGAVDGGQIQLQDATGKVINTNMQVMEQSFDGITQMSLYVLTIPQNANPEPVKFVLVGRRMATVEVPFSLKDVPLP